MQSGTSSITQSQSFSPMTMGLFGLSFEMFLGMSHLRFEWCCFDADFLIFLQESVHALDCVSKFGWASVVFSFETDYFVCVFFGHPKLRKSIATGRLKIYIRSFSKQANFLIELFFFLRPLASHFLCVHLHAR